MAELDNLVKILRIISSSSSQVIYFEQVVSKAKVFSIEEKDTVEALEILKFNDLVDNSGNTFYTTSKGSIIANRTKII